MDYKTIKTEIADNICCITLDNPASLNALSELNVQELIHALDKIEADNFVRVVLITGSGKVFCAGGDISEMAEYSAEQGRAISRSVNTIYKKIENSKKVYIAVVNGHALGGGCELALSCDICIASEKAKFALPEVTLGILPGGGGTQRLGRLVGIKKAMEIILTGDRIEAHEAMRIGIVNQVLPGEDLLTYAREMAGRIIKNAPRAVHYAKECIRQCEEMTLEAGLEYENTMFGLCFTTSDQKEGMKAFLEKRPIIYPADFVD